MEILFVLWSFKLFPSSNKLLKFLLGLGTRFNNSLQRCGFVVDSVKE